MVDAKQQEQYAEIERILKAANHYQVLGVQKEVEDEELKKVYKRLALLLHPDKVRLGSEKDRPRAEQAFRGVQVAYETLKAPHTRKSYDLKLRMAKTTTFVPGESSEGGEDSMPEDEDSISTQQFFLALLLQCCISSFIFAWFVFEVAWWKAGFMVILVYAFNKLVPPKLSLKYLAAALIFQIQNWSQKEAVPGYTALFLTLDCLLRLDFSILGALGIAFLVLGTLWMGLLFERMYFTGTYTFTVSLVLVFFLTYNASPDVFAAVFLGLLSWNFLQGIPTICLLVLVLVALYLAYRLSVLFLIILLSTALVFIGEKSTLAYYGWLNTFLVALCVGGARFAVGGLPGGKRTMLSVGLVWCLDCSWLSGTVVFVIIFFAGFLLSMANLDPEPEGDMPRRRRSDAPSDPGAAKGASKNKKKKK